MSKEKLRSEALAYHAKPQPGKISCPILILDLQFILMLQK